MNKAVIEQLIPLADAHQAADEYAAGNYWEGNGRGTGCSVGCTVHDAIALGVLPKGTDHGSHAELAAATGMPEMLWRLADYIFEGLPQSARREWTPRLLRAAAGCPDIDRVPARIMYRCAMRLADEAIRPDVRESALTNAQLWLRRATCDEPTQSEWDAARQQAYAAYQQAYAARQQADAAYQQAGAAWQQAYAAWQQAYAAWQQAGAAWRQADAAWQQAGAARQRFWIWLSDVVCEELSGAK